MPGSISIDSTTGEAKVLFVDDKGDTDAAAPAGAVVTYRSSDETVATVDASTGKITPVKEGTTNIGADILDASGNPVLEPDGTTPFSVPDSAITIVAGAAVGAELQIQS